VHLPSETMHFSEGITMPAQKTRFPSNNCHGLSLLSELLIGWKFDCWFAILLAVNWTKMFAATKK
ncbi:MAG: hypothetical protein P8X67_12015, partial [Syntrophobacterales bacterium]